MPLPVNLKDVETNLKAIMPQAEAVGGWNKCEEAARCLRLLGRNDDAAAWFLRAAEAAVMTAGKTGSGRLHLMAANFVRLAGRPEAMAPYLSKGLEMIGRQLDPDLANDYGLMALGAYLQGRLNEVTRWTGDYRKYGRVKQVTPLSLPDLFARARLQKDAAPIREALAAIEQMVKKQRLKPWYCGAEVSLFDWYDEGEPLLLQM